jgi:hypothetical protein
MYTVYRTVREKGKHCVRLQPKRQLSTKSTAAVNTSPVISQGEVSNCVLPYCMCVVTRISKEALSIVSYVTEFVRSFMQLCCSTREENPILSDNIK